MREELLACDSLKYVLWLSRRRVSGPRFTSPCVVVCVCVPWWGGLRAGTCASPSPTVQNRRTPRMCGTRTCALWPLFVVVPLWLWLCMCLCLCLCLLAIAVWLQLSWWVGDKGDGAGTTAWHAGRACSPWPHRSWPRHSNAAPPFDSPLARCRRHRHDRWCRRHSPNPARRLMVERCPTVNATTSSRTRLTRTREDLRVWHRRVAPLTATLCGVRLPCSTVQHHGVVSIVVKVRCISVRLPHTSECEQTRWKPVRYLPCHCN